jgi:hypothetical protein
MIIYKYKDNFYLIKILNFMTLKDIISNWYIKWYTEFSNTIEEYVYTILDYIPKIIWAIIIVWVWLLIAVFIYKIIIYIFNKFKIIEFIDNIFIDFKKHEIEELKKTEETKKTAKSKALQTLKYQKISSQIKIDTMVAKSISYYIFLIFFRWAIVFIWINEVEKFLWDIITYLPNLFIAIVIWFFWIRFADFVYDLVYNALNLTKQKNAKIIAMWWKIVILFFTLMIMLPKIWVSTTITDTIFIWSVSMVALAGWLAFGLWWKDVAHEILENFKK